jgi:hypothetical protein
LSLNVVTDLVTALIFIPTLSKLRMPRGRQLAVCCLFGSRVMYVSHYAQSGFGC